MLWQNVQELLRREKAKHSEDVQTQRGDGEVDQSECHTGEVVVDVDVFVDHDNAYGRHEVEK